MCEVVRVYLFRNSSVKLKAFLIFGKFFACSRTEMFYFETIFTSLYIPLKKCTMRITNYTTYKILYPTSEIIPLGVKKLVASLLIGSRFPFTVPSAETQAASRTWRGTTLRWHFFLRKRGHFLKIERALLCLLQNHGGTCPQCPGSYRYVLLFLYQLIVPW